MNTPDSNTLTLATAITDGMSPGGTIPSGAALARLLDAGLTSAQTKAIAELVADMTGTYLGPTAEARAQNREYQALREEALGSDV